MSDMGSDFSLAEGMDNELLYEEEAMLVNPAPYEEEVALENPTVVEENYDANVSLEDNTQDSFVDTFNSEEATDSAITGGDPVFIDGDDSW